MNHLEDNKISVIVPVYKVEPYLRKCIDSILAQTHSNLEIILVDDGSPDACGAICEEYAAKDTRITVIHQENGGLSSARNAGLDIMTGNFCAFVDSDDYIAPTMYESMLHQMLNNNAELCICGCFDEYENGSPLENAAPSPLKDVCLTADRVFYMMCYTRGGVYSGVCNKLYRASLFVDHRFAIGRVHEDEFMAHHIVGACQRIVTMHECFYHYVSRIGSICQVPYSAKRLDAAWALYDRYEYFKSHGYPDLARRSWQAAYGFLVTGLSRLSLKENWNAFAPLIKKVAFQSYLDPRSIKIMLIVTKKWLKETF